MEAGEPVTLTPLHIITLTVNAMVYDREAYLVAE